MGQHGSPAWWGFFLWKCLEQLPCRVTHFLLLCHILVRPVWQRLFSLRRCLSLLSPTSEAWDDVNGSAPGRMRQDFQETASKPQTSKKKKEKNPKREEKKKPTQQQQQKTQTNNKKRQNDFLSLFSGSKGGGWPGRAPPHCPQIGALCSFEFCVPWWLCHVPGADMGWSGPWPHHPSLYTSMSAAQGMAGQQEQGTISPKPSAIFAPKQFSSFLFPFLHAPCN